jgi:uncharacterized Fe-S center protein
MSEVYYTKSDTNDNLILSQIAKKLLINLIKKNDLKLNKEIPLKVHFGEQGCETFVPAKCYDGIIEYLFENKIDTSFIETNALYKGERMFAATHKELAKRHGFTQIPIIIADGDHGESYNDIEINKPQLNKCKIGKEFENFNQIIVCSHFKGHILAGFGGAIKQLGMGFAARGGKMEQHNSSAPVVNKDKCNGCGNCFRACGANAIQLNKQAIIDEEKCIHCAGCIAMCPIDAITFSWFQETFMQKLTEYAFAAMKNKKILYVTFLINITKDCDCMSDKQEVLSKNLGVMASLDPVAIDTAALEIFQKQQFNSHFETARKSLVYAESIGMGSMTYNLIELS